jgi:hypothetical protein
MREVVRTLQRYVQLLARLPDVQIRTYDDVLDFERAKVDLIKKASEPASDAGSPPSSKPMNLPV